MVTAGGGEPFTYVGWDFDGDPTAFSDDELTIIQLAWQALAEDFRPFDIDVTTEEPPIEDLKKTSEADTRWGIRCVVNHRTYDYSWAYVGSFNSPFDVEMFAWTGDFPGDIAETWLWLADSVNHEAGHALGLQHHGTTAGVEYYPGHGEGDVAWSPIMGWTNYGLSQWSKGEYALANNSAQDDLQVITTQNGFGFREDDHGQTLDLAGALDFEGSSVGIIERPDDLDGFTMDLPSPGRFLVQATTDDLNPNLDIALTLMDEAGEVRATANPDEALNAELDLTLDAGRYLLLVDGVGRGAVEEDGYSDYGSLGLYTLVASFDAESDTGAQDTDDSGSADTDTGSAETGVADRDSGGAISPTPPDGRGCGCASGHGPKGWSLLPLLGLVLGVLGRRR